MRVTVYRAELIGLIDSLIQPDLIARWRALTAEEMPAVADARLVRHLKRIDALAEHCQREDFDAVCVADRVAADALLTDLFAVATWHRWPIAAEVVGERDLPLDGLPRGLLAVDAGADGALVVVIDDEHVALARNRVADDQADTDNHDFGGLRAKRALAAEDSLAARLRRSLADDDDDSTGGASGDSGR